VGEKLITSAESRFAANSKLLRVRVLGSKNSVAYKTSLQRRQLAYTRDGKGSKPLSELKDRGKVIPRE
jgi:hypothetical protein